MRYLVIFVFIALLSGVLASDYSIDFNQVGDSLIVRDNNSSSYVSNNGLDKTAEGYYFIKRIKANENYSVFTIRLILEAGVVAKTGEIFPAGFIFSTDGQTINLIWNYTNVSKGDDFAFFVSLEDKKRSLLSNWFYLAGVIFLLLVSFFGFKYLKNKRKQVDKYLLDEEKKVIQLLKQSEEKEMWQKNIQSSLAFSKAKVSRMIRNLESRGLIEKIPFGNTNKIKLK